MHDVNSRARTPPRPSRRRPRGAPARQRDTGARLAWLPFGAAEATDLPTWMSIAPARRRVHSSRWCGRSSHQWPTRVDAGCSSGQQLSQSCGLPTGNINDLRSARCAGDPRDGAPPNPKRVGDRQRRKRPSTRLTLVTVIGRIPRLRGPRGVGWGPLWWGCVRRCPTLPHPGGCSTIGAGGLSFRVRDGSGRFPSAMAAVTRVELCRAWVCPCSGSCTVDAFACLW